MATTMTCDHCGQPIDRDEAVRLDIVMPYHAWAKLSKSNDSLAKRARAAEEAAARLAAAHHGGHYDLHEHCYETTILPHLTAAIGAPS